MTYEHKVINEKRSFTEYTVSSPTQSFAIGFELYEDEQNIHITLDNTPIEDLGYTFAVINSLTVEVTPAIPSGVLRIQRETNIDENKHKFSAGAIFNALSMDANFEQIRNSQQEVRDGFSNLSDRVIPLVDGLEEALEQASVASQAAQEAANSAEQAAQVTRLASQVIDASGETQQQVNYNGGAKWHSRVGGYQENERVVLANGYIVKSTVDGNTNNPNVDMTGWGKPNDLTGNPHMFGGKGDGVFDDTLAIQACANNFRYLDMRNGTWKTTGKITLREGTVVDLRGAYLSANNANEPIFEFENAGDGLSILGGGGYVYGTADSFLKCSGKTYQPTVQTDYARQIRLDGVHVSSENIDKFLDFDKAVRQVFMTKVFSYTRNGMFCNGKCVEIEIYGSIIYGAKGAGDLNTFGIKYRSPGNGRWYNEGLHITDSTIDNFGITFDITDIYAMSVTGGHVGAAIQADGHNAPGALVAKFGQPTSTACRNIKFANVNIYGNIEFAPAGGLGYQAKFTGCSSEAAGGANISIKNNASSITVSNHTFHSSTNNGVAVVCWSNNFNISVNDITCDQTFVGGVHVLGAVGDNVSVRGISYAGTGDPIYYDRPILISGVPVATANMANRKRTLVNTPPSTYAVSQTIATVSEGFAKGETGEIVVELSYSGATQTNQVLQVNIPDGLVVPSGSNWNSLFVPLKSESGTISARIPYFVTKSIASANIALVNFGGSALTLGYHGYFGIQRDW